MEQDIYVVVAENNLPHKTLGHSWIDSGGEMVFEQYTKDASLENAKKMVEKVSERYGKCRIAKLQFID